MENITIRRINVSDDFEQLLQMMNDTAKKFNPDPTFFGFGMSVQDLREEYADSSNSQGFVAESNGSIVAFMGISLSDITKNGHLVFGYTEASEAALINLVEKCMLVVRQNGGKKLLKFASCKFGQIRNSEISFWERMGFNSEEYANVSLMLSINEWQEPIDFCNLNIGVVPETELGAIKQLLIEDGEDIIAELVSNHSRKNIIIALRDDKSNEIIGLAYYFVDLVNKGTSNEFLNAYAFTLHFRPKYDLSRSEKLRLLHASLLSAKQLGALYVITRITLKNFEVFTLMIREGFDDVGMEKNSTVNLYKMVRNE